jgi:hypothetical protein
MVGNGRPGRHLPALDGAENLLAPAVGLVVAGERERRDIAVAVTGLTVLGEERRDVPRIRDAVGPPDRRQRQHPGKEQAHPEPRAPPSHPIASSVPILA